MALLSFCLCGWLRSTKGTKSTKGVRGPFGCGWGARAPFGGRCAGLRPHLRASRWSSPPGGEEGGRNVVRVIGLCAKFVRAGRARSVAGTSIYPGSIAGVPGGAPLRGGMASMWCGRRAPHCESGRLCSDGEGIRRMPIRQQSALTRGRLLGWCGRGGRAPLRVRASILDRSRASRGGAPLRGGMASDRAGGGGGAIHRARRGGGSRAADRDARHKRIIAPAVAEYVTGKRVKSTRSCLGEVAARPLTNGGRLDNPYRSCVKE